MTQTLHVRPLKGERETGQFKRIAKYCFDDSIGWTDVIFPLRHGDRAWGAFRGRTLESGLVTRNYQARLWGDWRPMSGISLVETPPEYRNGRNITALFTHVLPAEHKRGLLLSSLYPFKFEYYEKYGYGMIGGLLSAAFAPENILAEKPIGEFVPFQGEKWLFADYLAVREEWVSRFSLGVKLRPTGPKEFVRELEWKRERLVLYYEGTECAGGLRFEKKIFPDAPADLFIRRIGWRHGRAFRALMYFLKSHRNQIKQVHWLMPSSVPLPLVMQNPRIVVQRQHDWMARPIDLETLCRLKARARPAKNEVAFAVEDGILVGNTGTYRIKGDAVRKEKYDAALALPLPLLSSLLFGGCSPADARLAGKLGEGRLAGAEDFFAPDPDLYLSEFF